MLNLQCLLNTLRVTPIVAALSDKHTQPLSNILDPCHIFCALITTKDLIHLFDSQSLRFRNTEVDPDDEDETEDEKEVKCAKGDGFKHSWCDQCDDKLNSLLVKHVKILC